MITQKRRKLREVEGGEGRGGDSSNEASKHYTILTKGKGREAIEGNGESHLTEGDI